MTTDQLKTTALPADHYIIHIPNVPKGWEPTGEYRPWKKGETILTLNNDIHVTSYEGDATEKFIILRKKWTPPASAKSGLTFFPAGDNKWYATCCDVIKSKISGAYYTDGSVVVASDFFSDFTPPPELRPYTVP